MKSCAGGAAFLALLIMNGVTFYQVDALKAEVRDLKAKVAQERKNTDLMAEAVQTLDRARKHLGKTDTSEARKALEETVDTLSKTAKSAGGRAEPAIRWLQDQADNLKRQIENGGRTGP